MFVYCLFICFIFFLCVVFRLIVFVIFDCFVVRGFRDDEGVIFFFIGWGGIGFVFIKIILLGWL